MTSHGAQRTRLAEQLRGLRRRTHPSQVAFAETLGWPQSRVSKLETGAQRATDEDVRAWAAASAATDSELGELLDLLDQTRLDYTSSRHAAAAAGGLEAQQNKLGVLEAQAQRIGEYQPGMLPGLIQTPSYARELLSLPTGGPLAKGATPDDLEALIAARVRRQNLLYEPGRTVQLVIGEAALRTRPGTVEVMAAQLDRLLSLAELASLDLRVLTFDTPMPVMPLSGFSLLDEDTVHVETVVGQQQLADPDDVNVYLAVFDRLRADAAAGRDAIDIIRRSAEALGSSNSHDN